MGKVIRCTKIGVDCVVNDPVDVRCGGPEYLGFDFNVPEDQTEEMKKFISAALNNFDVPVTAIYACGEIDLSEDDVWTKEKIVKAISEDAEYLKTEASRNYTR